MCRASSSDARVAEPSKHSNAAVPQSTAAPHSEERSTEADHSLAAAAQCAADEAGTALFSK